MGIAEGMGTNNGIVEAGSGTKGILTVETIFKAREEC